MTKKIPVNACCIVIAYTPEGGRCFVIGIGDQLVYRLENPTQDGCSLVWVRINEGDIDTWRWHSYSDTA